MNFAVHSQAIYASREIVTTNRVIGWFSGRRAAGGWDSTRSDRRIRIADAEARRTVKIVCLITKVIEAFHRIAPKVRKGSSNQRT